MTGPSAADVAVMFGCTVEQARAQYGRCACALDALADKAAAHRSGVYRSKTEAQWRASADEYRAKAAA